MTKPCSRDRRRRACRGASAVSLGLLALSLATPPDARAAETWYQAYESALRAVKAGDWRLAEEKLRFAQKNGPSPSRQVRTYGLQFIAFLPEYYLGVVYANQGKQREALALLNRVEKEGLVTARDPEYEELSRLVKAAQESLKVEENAKRAQADQEAKARQEQERIKAEKEQQAKLERLIADGGEALAARKFGDARSLATAARETGVDAARVETLMKSIRVGESLERLRGAVSQRDWVQAQSLAREVASLDPENEDLKPLQALIAKGLDAGVGAEIETAALRAFYSGDYSLAIALLERAAARQESARVYLYMACSNATLGLLQGQGGRPLIEKARAQFARARRLDARLVLDRRFISPRVLRALETP